MLSYWDFKSFKKSNLKYADRILILWESARKGPLKHNGQKWARNELCYCHSGLKLKKCCKQKRVS